MANSSADRNLLFGVLAVQMDFISRDQLIAAMHAWVLAKEKPLGQVLQDQNALSGERHILLEALVKEHLKQHENDPEKSLAALSSAGSLPRNLGMIADPDVQASMVHVAAARGKANDPQETISHVPGTSTGPGQRFRIVRPHAKGGLGEVFVANDQELHREVALKEIQNRHADDPASRARFLLEAEITGGLEHPGIVPVYGLGQYADGRPFYAMRFIRGDSLKDAIDRFHKGEPGPSAAGERALEFRKLLGRFVDVCQAMQYAHDRGVLHRDLKPGNIMLGKYGETLVVDWGLAKAVGKRSEPDESATFADEPTLRPSSASGSAETVAGTALGTPAYMSPEQAAGRLDLLGPSSDVYSLGATLYCLLTGKPPIEGKDVAEVLRSVGNGDYPRPRQRSSGIDPALEAICLKAMALCPADRYTSPRQMADDLEHWLAGEPVSAWPEPITIKLRRWMRQHRTMVTGAAAALLVGLIALSIGGFLGQIEQNRRTAELALRREYLNKEVNAALSEATESRRDLHSKLTDYRKVHELLSDIDQWQGLVQQVKAPVERARSLANGDPHLLNEDSSAGLLDLEKGAESDENDWAFAKALDEVRFSHGRAARKYQSIFSARNLIVESQDAEEIAKYVARSRVRYAILAAMELWATETEDRKLQKKLLEAARRADPNQWRDRFRDVEAWGDLKRLEQLAKELVPEEQSPQIILTLAGRLDAAQMSLRAKPMPKLEEIKKPKGTAPPPEPLKKPKGAAAPLPKERNMEQAFRPGNPPDEELNDLRPSSRTEYVLLFAQGEGQSKDTGMPPQPPTLADDATDARTFSKTLSGFGVNQNKQWQGFNPSFPQSGSTTEMGVSVEPSPGAAPRREFDLVAKILDQALLYYPRDFWLLCVLARTARDREEEAAFYRAALAIRPKSSAAHSNLGDALRDLGRLDPAIRHYRKAVELDPNDAIPRHHLAVALLVANKGVDEGLKHLREAERLDPNFTISRDLLGKINRHEITPAELARRYRYEVAGNIDAPTTEEEEVWLTDLVKRLEEERAPKKQVTSYQDWYRGATPVSRKRVFLIAAEEKQLQELTKVFGKALDPLTKEETKLLGKLTDAKTDDVHELKLTAGKPVVIEMQSRHFNTLLRLQDVQGKTLAENDAIGSANREQISRILFVPNKDGAYRIIATSFQKGGRGEYEIIVRQFSTLRSK